MQQMQITSLWAWRDIAETLGSKQKEVLGIIEIFPGITDREISKKLNWEINCVTGRRNELMKMGLIKKAEIRYYNGRPANSWELV